MLLITVPVESTSTFQIGDLINLFSTLITVLGFVITYKCLKKEYNLAIIKEKNLYATNEMKDALNPSYELLWTYMRAFAYGIELKSECNNQKKFIGEAKKFRALRDELGKMIVKFGSLKSVKLWTHFEHNIISIGDENGSVITEHENSNYYIISVLILIIAQIKYDIYGLELSPKYIFLSLFSQEITEMNDFFDNIIE